jgi:hypothetical protein
LFNVVASKRSGRNNALNYVAWAFREIVAEGAIEASGATSLLVEASKANGYLAKDGEEAVRATIMSGLGLKGMAGSRKATDSSEGAPVMNRSYAGRKTSSVAESSIASRIYPT